MVWASGAACGAPRSPGHQPRLAGAAVVASTTTDQPLSSQILLGKPSTHSTIHQALSLQSRTYVSSPTPHTQSRRCETLVHVHREGERSPIASWDQNLGRRIIDSLSSETRAGREREPRHLDLIARLGRVHLLTKAPFLNVRWNMQPVEEGQRLRCCHR